MSETNFEKDLEELLSAFSMFIFETETNDTVYDGEEVLTNNLERYEQLRAEFILKYRPKKD